jgi:hypothetical protein
MKFRHLAVQLGLTAVVLAAANLGVRRLAENSVPRQLLRHGDGSQPATDLFLGNSTMAAGLDETTFAAVQPRRRPLNLALGATGPVEHLLIYHQQKKHRGAAVYYGFLDTQLTDAPQGSWDKLIGNRALSYYADPETAIRFYAKDSPFEALAFRFVAKVPMLVERVAIWAKVERLRRILGEIGFPKKETNRFGRAEDFVLLEPDPGEFARKCERAAVDRVSLASPVAALIREAEEGGSKVYVVEMPMTFGHRERFYSGPQWAAYRMHLIDLVQSAGAVYVAGADWVADDGFADHLHLNEAGSRSFSTRLGNWTPEKH